MRKANILFQILLLIMGVFLFSNPMTCQSSVKSIHSENSFSELQKSVDGFFENNPEAKGRKQWERKKWFLEQRLLGSNRSINLAQHSLKIYREYRKNHPPDRSTHGDWNFIGPSQNASGIGRVNGIAFHPIDTNIIYLGSSNGGIWKTTNNGILWQNISPDIPLLAIADIALDPNNPQIVYALTGDGDPVPGESAAHTTAEVSSMGILKSIDGGNSWFLSPFDVNYPSDVRPTKLLMHPTNGLIQFVVGHHGILRTEDGWQTIDTIVSSHTVYDIEYKPGDNNTMYYAAKKSIFRSTNGGDSWLRVFFGDSTEFDNASRIELAIAPSAPNILYALGGNFDEYSALYKSDDSGSGDSWQLQNSSNGLIGGQAPYSIAMAVDPLDHNIIYAGMVWITKSLDGGVSWNFGAVNVHADQHHLEFGHGRLWSGCDGGIYKQINSSNTWSPRLGGLQITEVYRVAGTAQNTELYFAGTQDNGTLKKFPNNSTTYFQALGGDGMVCEIDYIDQNNVFASMQRGRIFRSQSAGDPGTFAEALVPGDDGAWITPFIISRSSVSSIYVGKDKVWKLSFIDLPPAPGIIYTNLGSPTGGNLNNLAQGTDNPFRMYASDGAVLKRTDEALGNDTAAWTDISISLPNLFITDIALDPDDADKIYVTCSGYSNANKVFSSSNGGDNWTNISGTLPNVPANCIEFHDNGFTNDALYVGTDFGVFYRDNDIGDWIYFSNSMPAVTVSDLYINTGDNTIVAGTYGRGLWQSSLYSNCPSVLTLSNPTSTPLGGTRYYSAGNHLNSSVKYRLGLVSNVHYQSGTNIILTEGFRAGGHGFFEAKLGPCPDNVFEPSVQPNVSPSGIIINQVIEVSKN